MPEGTLNGLAIGRHHVCGRPVAALPGLNERRKNLPVALVVAVFDLRLDRGRRGHGLIPEVAHVVALTSIVPGLELKHVRLQVQGLTEAVLEVVFTAAVPVVAAIEVLELDRRDAHHEELRCSLSLGLESLVVVRRHHNLSSASLGPRVPVEDSVDVLVITERGAWVDLVVTRDYKHVANCLLKICPGVYVLASESGDHRLAVELEVRSSRDVALEVVCVIAWVLEMAGCVVEGEEEPEAKIIGVLEQSVDSVVRPVCELVCSG
jgi:hypothetical protein